MMGNPPVSVNGFLVELRRLESISTTEGQPCPILSKEETTTTRPDSSSRSLEALTNKEAILTRAAGHPLSPGPEKSTQARDL